MADPKGPCGYVDCDHSEWSRGYCHKHYDYLRNSKQLSSLTDRDRYLAKVDVCGPDECWPWTGATQGSVNGRAPYGSIRWNGKTECATRAGWEVHHGEFPSKGLDVCHTCDNPSCQNPSHWFLGTRAENFADARAKGRKRPAPPRATTVEQDDEIRRLLALGATQRYIARDLSVSRWVVSQIALYRRGESH